MRVCFLGYTGSGSWAIRGIQIASMCPEWVAKDIHKLSFKDINKYDLFIIVKHFHHKIARMLKKNGKKVVYDIIDCWKQPEDGMRCKTLPMVIDYFKRRLAAINVDGVIFANMTMKADLEKFVSNPTTIYHHYRPNITPIKIKPRARIVGYEGSPVYLGHWGNEVRRICRAYNLDFVINPKRFTDIDIGFAARNGKHGSLMATRYKSNVKLANFYAAGIPCIFNTSEVSCVETNNGHVLFFTDSRDLEFQLRYLLPYQNRLAIHKSFMDFRHHFDINKIVKQYNRYFEEIITQ